MKNGICPKCASREVYFSNATGLQAPLRTGDGSPSLQIYKENRFIPDIDVVYTDTYVCKGCGYVEIYARDLDMLTKLDDCTNWMKMRAGQHDDRTTRG